MLFSRLADIKKKKSGLPAGGDVGVLAVVNGNTFTPPPANARALLKLYSESPWVRTILSKVASAVAEQSWYLEGASGERIDRHPALAFIRAGNSELRGRQAVKLTQLHLDLNGEAFWVIGRKGPGNTGAPVAYAPIPPTWITDTPNTADGVYTIHPINSVPYTLAAADVLWFRDPDPLDPYGRGKGIANAAFDEIDTDQQAATFLRSYFANRARPDLVVTGTDKHPIADKDRVRMEETWNAKLRGASRAGKPIFAPAELKIQEIGSGLRDNQMVELRTQLQSAISEIFAIPPEILGRIKNSNRATVEAADLIFAKFTVRPRLALLLDYLSPWLDTEFRIGDTLRFDDPVQEDREFALKAMAADPEAFSRDDLRELIGYKPLRTPEFATPRALLEPPETEEPETEGENAPETEEPETEGENAPETRKLVAFPGGGRRNFDPARIVEISGAHQDPQVRAELTQAMERIFKASLARYGGELLEMLSVQVRFELNMRTAEFILREVPSLFGFIDETTRRDLLAAITDGAAAGEALDAISQRVEDVFEMAARTRGPSIAATIATRVTGFASLEAAKQGGFERKQWLSSQDQVVRGTHASLDGQIVPTSGEFQSASGARAAHPGGFGVASEDINCRCAMRPVIDGERAAGDADDPEAFRDWHEAAWKRVADDAEATVRDIFQRQKRVALDTFSAIMGANQPGN